MASDPAASRRTRDRHKSVAANNLSQYEQGVRYQALSTQFQKRAEDFLAWQEHYPHHVSSDADTKDVLQLATPTYIWCSEV